MITAGHPLDAIKGYNLRQVQSFLGAIVRDERHRLRQQLLVARAGQASAEAFEALWAEWGQDGA